MAMPMTITMPSVLAVITRFESSPEVALHAGESL